ncbi:DUF1272 domain-containing protein [Oceanospirillum sediminis]|uniref:DUF1272 domain-containing protein n=1 Tax=Oceanospirillum sediminis TaxID=2760088 RepID=A0A839IMD5_9GAMM|nr:DUF1272 domain-containing protein [Oceanospirillum sediminis]MBB1485880.1 DUF1272 domain-containing protein [Oceanospirillum sediminis]
MLELRPNCECCDNDLPVDATDAMICSYECTFCRDCVDMILHNVCPNCGGGFSPRPIRPSVARREGVSLSFHPASERRVHTSFSREALIAFSERVKGTPPSER